VANAQAVERYEIARYGTLIAWPEELRLRRHRFLTTNLNEEKATNSKLNTVALRKGVNRKAASCVLAPLELDDVGQLVADAMHCEPDGPGSSGTIVHVTTGGAVLDDVATAIEETVEGLFIGFCLCPFDLKMAW
jgi:hypothetical protein